MKPIIYQLLPRLFTNLTAEPRPNGTIEQNGCGKLNDISEEILGSLRELGTTHVWLTGVLEHATSTDYSRYGIPADHPAFVKGRAGSPYAIRDYYDIDPDLAVRPEHRLEEFQALTERIHRAGMKVVIDFVPNHVARQYHSDRQPAGIEPLGEGDDKSLYFGHNNNFYYIPRQQLQLPVDQSGYAEPYVEFPARATGNDCFSAFPGVNDWFDTVKLNYGVDYGDGSRHFDPVPDTWYKMLHILRYWARMGVDAFRCDMVHMVPLEFWRWAIPAVKRSFPGVQFIAEIYEPGLYRPFIAAGFDYLYDKVNLYDKLRGIMTANLSAAQLTSAWQTVEGISDRMLNFLENHDEQRLGSPQFEGNPAHGIAPMVVSTLIGTGAMMIYMGQELGETGTDAEGFSGRDGRTSIFDYWSVPTLRRWLSSDCLPHPENLSAEQQRLRSAYSRILNLANTEKAISEGAFFDLMYVNYDNPRFNPHRHYAWLRSAGGTTLLCVANFDSRDAELEVNIPGHAFDVHGIRRVERGVPTELLTGDKMRLTLTDMQPTRVSVPAYGAVVWRFRTR